MLAHGNPGHDVPMWAMKTAVNSLAPIEPFKLFYKMNQGVLNNRDELEKTSRRLDDTELVASGGVSRRPAGLAQLGYACFWPNGGGVQEGVPAHPKQEQESASPELNHLAGDLRGVGPLDRSGFLATEPSAAEDDRGESGSNRESLPSRAGSVLVENLSREEPPDGALDSSSASPAPVLAES
jgi:hypothetical protein